jgi:hypothetical protein
MKTVNLEKIVKVVVVTLVVTMAVTMIVQQAMNPTDFVL